MKTVAGLLLCTLAIGSSAVAVAENGKSVMMAGDLQEICTDSSAESKAACRFYIFGVTQGVGMGMSIADGKTKSGRPCIPEDASGSALELAVKMKLGQDLMGYPEDRKLDATGLIGAILVHTFPCR